MKYVMIASLLLLAACDKDFVCECRTSGEFAGQTDTSRYIYRGSRSSAENSCVKLETKKREESGPALLECEITADQN